MTDRKTKKQDTIQDIFNELKEACKYFVQAKSTLKDKYNYYDFIIEKACKMYLQGNKNKQGFLYAFFECKLYPAFKTYFESQGVVFGSYNKGKNIFIACENDNVEQALKSLIPFSQWIKEKTEKEKQEKLEKQEALLKRDYKTFDLSRIKTVEEIEFYMLKLKQLRKDLQSQAID